MGLEVWALMPPQHHYCLTQHHYSLNLASLPAGVLYFPAAYPPPYPSRCNAVLSQRVEADEVVMDLQVQLKCSKGALGGEEAGGGWEVMDLQVQPPTHMSTLPHTYSPPDARRQAEAAADALRSTEARYRIEAAAAAWRQRELQGQMDQQRSRNAEFVQVSGRTAAGVT